MPIPSLVAICISVLAASPDALQVLHTLPFRLAHKPPNLIADVLPDPAALDPCLWAVLVQLYPSLPPFFASYALPLADPVLPVLQSIPASPLFSLVTLLNLSSSQHLTDQTIFRLKFLHALTALDISNTAITPYAIKSLAATLQLNEDEDSLRKHRGPWELRILSLRNCKQVSNDIYIELNRFPLLSVVDLRGTMCTRNATSPFTPSMHDELYHPAALCDSLKMLQFIQPELSASPLPYILTVDKLDYTKSNTPQPQGRAGIQDSFFIFPSQPAGKINAGNTYVLERQIQEREERIKHEQNKDAWYERKERMEDIEYYGNNNPMFRKPVKRGLVALGPLQNASTRLHSIPGALHPPSSEISHPQPSVARTSIYPSSRSSLLVNRSHAEPHLRLPLQPEQQRPHVPHSASTSTSALLPASAQHQPMTVLPSRPAYGSRSLTAHTNATLSTAVRGSGNAIQNGNISADGTRNETEHATPDMLASSSSARTPLTSLPIPIRRADPIVQRTTPNAATVSPAQFYGSSARRSAFAPKPASNSANAHLMLHRPPPPYSTLGQALALEKERRKQPCLGPVRRLDGEAVLNRHGKWALNAKEVIHATIENRMGTGIEMKKVLVVPTVSLTKSITRKNPYLLNCMPSAAASSSSAMMEPAHSTRPSRNPFRKSVLSDPGMPAYGAGSGVQASSSVSTSSSSPPGFISTSKKEAMKLPKNSTVGMVKDNASSRSKTNRISAPLPDASCTSQSLAPAIISGRQIMNSLPTVKPKPLIPISAVKVPILPDHMLQEALRREAEQILLSSRKRNRVDEGEADTAQEPMAKRVVKSTSMGGLKTKRREPQSAKAFDWMSWGKTGAPP